MLLFNNPDARNLNESFFLLFPSHPTFTTYPCWYSHVTEYDWQGFPSTDERIHFSKTLLIHASAEYCLLAKRPAYWNIWVGGEGDCHQRPLILNLVWTKDIDCWIQTRQKINLVRESKDTDQEREATLMNTLTSWKRAFWRIGNWPRPTAFLSQEFFYKKTSLDVTYLLEGRKSSPRADIYSYYSNRFLWSSLSRLA